MYEVTVQASDGNGGTDTQAISVTVTDALELIVTNTNATGTGSLHEAILNANANTGVTDTITFNIPGSGPHVINLTGALPAITDTVIIDGTTEPDYAVDPIIRIEGSSAGAGVNGLTFAANSDNSVVRGLMITGFTQHGIQIDSGADGITITNNWIGTTGTGSTGVGNGDTGINIQGANTVVGGTGANEGNVITNNGNEGINVTGSSATGTIIQGNIIGLDPDGSTGSGNDDVGIALLAGANNTTIGGTSAAARNVISKNVEGIEINSNNNVIQGNYIGTDAGGTLNCGNHSDDGVEIKGGASGNLIGGEVAGAGNIIAFNALNGVNVVDGTTNAIVRNSIHSNTLLGINLGTAGVTANDSGDADGGANTLQNFPVLTSAETNGSQITISGSLNSTPSTSFRIEFYSNVAGDVAGYGEGQTLIGVYDVTTDGSGNAAISVVLPAAVSAGSFVSATVSRLDAGDAPIETSEFAQNVVATAAGNTAPVITTSGGAMSYTEQAAAKVIDAGITLVDPDGFDGTDPSDQYIAVIRITGNYEAADILGFTDTTKIQGALTGDTLNLSVIGGQTASVAEFQAALRSVTFYNGIDTPGTLDRTISFTFDDGVDSSNIATKVVQVTEVNDHPMITSNGGGDSANISVAENTTAVTTVTVNDPDGGTPVFTLISGADQSKFAINSSSGVLTFQSAPDFENPTDADADNVYEVVVLVSDGNGGTDTQAISVTVTDANDAPVAVNDSYIAVEGIPFTAELGLNDLLLNDTDADGDAFTVNTTPVSGPANGSLVLNADGTFTYTPNNNFNGTDSFVYEVSDGNGGTAQATVTITVQPREIRILFTTQSDVNNSKVPGISSWDAGDVLGIGEPNLTFEPAGSDGSVLPYMDLEAFAASNNLTVNGLHFVSNDITVGGANSVTLQRGDLLFVSDNNEVMTSTNSLAINAGDVIVFRPDAIDDYTSGTFIHLLDQPHTAKTTGITMVEKDVLIGDVTLPAGTFLFTQESVDEESSIYHFSADDVGAGTTTGTVSTLISSVDVDVNWNNFVGVMVINEDLYLNGTVVPAGSIVTTLSGGDSFVGNNGIEINEDEIFYLTVTSTTMGSGTTVADATLLFDGGDIGLNNNSKKMRCLTIIEEITPVANADPVITLTPGFVNYTEQDPPTIIGGGATLTDPDSADFDGGLLRIDFGTTGTANDRLAINHEGNAIGEIGISGNTVSYGGTEIGTFAGGTDGSDPLTIVFNASADVAAVEALIQNITYENVSSNPSTAQRTARFSVTDGDGGDSGIVTRTIVINSVNAAPVLTGANDLTPIGEDAFNNGGTLVSDLISGWVTDADPAALQGIVVVSVDNTNGSWEFSMDGGTTWSALGSPSAADARLLAADAQTYVRFVPNPNWSGTVTNGITFHAWDQTSGINGDAVNLTLSDNVRDQFGSVSYSNNDGSAVWTSDWIESNDNADAATGNIRVESAKLYLDNQDGGSHEAITRAADLSSATSATLTFDYDGYGSGSLDTIGFEVSNDGGATWTLLESIDVVGNVSGSKSFALENFTALTADMQIRFRVLTGFDGASQHINFDNVDISYTGPGVGGSGAVSVETESSSITVNSINDAPVMTGWVDSAWTARKVLTIDASQVAGDLTDFPVLISLNVDADLVAQALANGDDIIFTAGDGTTPLPHEIEYFDETTGELRAWVKTDLSSNVDTHIYMYYGNSGATNQENAAGVWSSNYVGVYHLEESPTGAVGELVDSSGSGNHATTEGAMNAADSVSTAIGNGLAFDGTDDKIRITDSASLDGLNDAATFSLWINWVDAADGDHQIVMTSENRFSGGDGYEWASQGDGDHFFYPDATTPDGNYNLGPNPFTNGQWHHLAVTMDYAAKEVIIYVDGNEMAFTYEGVPTRWTDLSSSGDLLWGGNPDRATRFFLGMMDEIRLSDVVRSQEWIQTEVNNQTNPGAFLAVGAAEAPQTQHTLTDIDEDDVNSAGDSVLAIINSVGGDRITDSDVGAVEGIAVVGVDDTNGEWQYDANADGTWLAFGSVSDSAAVLLDTGALVRFVPDPDYNGSAGDLTFRAWDQTTGSNGDTGVDVSTNGGDSAYSNEKATATLNVTAVNDVPVATTNTVTTTEDTAYSFSAADFTFTDTEGNALVSATISNLNLNGGTLSHSGGVAVNSGDTLTAAELDTLVYTPAGNATGSPLATFDFTVNDAGAGVVAAQMSITVTAVNDVPVATANTVTTTEDTAYSFSAADFTFTDTEGNALVSATISNLNLNGGTLSHSGGVAVNSGDTLTAAELDTLVYTPAGNATGSPLATFDFTVNDAGAGVVAAQMSITVTAVNDVPVATANTVTTTEDTAYSFSAADFTFTDTEGNALVSATISNLNLNGGTLSHSGGVAVNSGDTLTAAELDTLVYTPAGNATGSPLATFDFTVNDAGAGVVAAQMSITVTAVNDVPVATANTVTTTEDTAYSFSAADFTFTDTEGNALVSAAISNLNLNGGTLSHSGGVAVNSGDTLTAAELDTLVYTPAGNATGSPLATFDFTVNDAGAGVVAAQMSITVTAVNDVPVATANTVTTTEDTAYSFSAADFTFTDTEGNALVSATISNLNLNGGTLSHSGGVAVNSGDTLTAAELDTLVYTPAGNATGSPLATFDFTVNDAGAGVVAAQMSITVTAVNDVPTTVGIADVTVNEDAPDMVVDLFAAFADAEDADAALTYTVTTNTNPTLFTSTIIDGVAGTLTLDYAPHANGTADITVRATDTGGLFVETTFTVTVNAVNDTPTTSGIADVTVAEDAPDSVVDLFAAFADVEDLDPALTYSITGNTNPGLFTSTTIDGVAGSLTLNYAADQNGSSDITVRATDTGGQFVETTFTVTVNAVNDTPTTVGIADITVDEDAADSVVDLFAAFADVEDLDPALTYSITNNTNPGLFTSTSIDGVAGSLTLNYAADQNGSADITVRATDTGGLFVETTFTVTVNPVNDTPTTSGIADITVDEDAADSVVDLFAAFADLEDADAALTYTVTANTNPALFTSTAIDAVAGTLTLDYAANQSGTADITVRATDTGGLFVETTFTVTVNPVNDVPVASDATINATEDTPYNGTLPFATDADGDTVTYSLDTDAVNGTAVVNADGSFSYSAALNANGADSFTYMVSDGNGGVNIYTVTVNVAAVNDAPVGLVTIDNMTPAAGDTLTASNTLADADGLSGPISYQWYFDGVAIGGATGNTYTTVPADVGGVITVVASYTDDQGTFESVTSAATAVVTNMNNLPTGSVTISGTPTEDQILTAANTLADADGIGVVSYQWQRDGVDIVGATGTTYTLGDLDVGTTITVVAGYTDGGGTNESVTSAGVGPIANVNDAPTTAPVTLALIAEDSWTRLITQAELLANAADADGDSLTAVGLSISSGNGTLVDNGDGTWTYTPAQNDNTAVNFSYTIGDGTVDVAASATLDITPVNDAPVIGGGNMVTVTEDVDPDSDGLLEVGGVLSISDPDIGESSFQAGTVVGTYGNLTIDASGNWNYTADNSQAAIQQLDAGESVIDVLTVTTADGTTHTITITINGAEDAPVIDEPPGPIDEGDGDPDPDDEVDPIITEPDEEPPIEESLPVTEETSLQGFYPSDGPGIVTSQSTLPLRLVAAISRMAPVMVFRNADASPSVNVGSLNFKTQDPASPTEVHFAPAATVFFSPEVMAQALDHLQKQINDTMEMDSNQGQLIIGAATGLGASVMVGYVVWAFRGASLMLGALSAMPMWRCFDPLPVLVGNDKKRDEDAEEKSSEPESEDDEKRVRDLLDSEQAIIAHQAHNGRRR